MSYPEEFDRQWAAGEAERKRKAYLRWLLNRSTATDVQAALKTEQRRLTPEK